MALRFFLEFFRLSPKTRLILPHVLFQVASGDECGQNGMPVMVSTHSVQLYHEGQCHVGTAPPGGWGDGEGSADPC